LNRFHLLKILVLTGIVGALTLGGTALAATASASQNPELTVSLDISPDQATIGDTVTVAGSVVSNASRPKHALITASLEGPNGLIYSISRSVLLVPGKEYALQYSFPVPEGTAAGTYTATLSAANSAGESSASASIEIV
jgi:uncharacterized protein (DUF58 family)